jgi:tetratricopeptide (TPR) repeat protein
MLGLTVSACAARSHGVAAATAPRSESLEDYIGKVRGLSSRVQPASAGTLVPTLETRDARLMAALTALSIAPSAAQHRQVAEEYQRLKVLDRAHLHYRLAIQMDPADAASHDALARIWREWGFPQLGIADAEAAVRLAPDSPIAANTLGTLFAADGNLLAARVWYARALTLAPTSAFALNNLCYTSVMLADRGAIGACANAAAATPASTTAQNNLGLAYAAEGDLARAHESFAVAGGPVAADFNLAIAHLARGEYRKATELFAAVLKAQPGFPGAAARVRQAGAALMAGHTTAGADHALSRRP